MKKNEGGKFFVGWGQADITPDEPVFVAGQFPARVSEGVLDPVTATALVLESRGGGFSDYAVMVSCDLVSIPDGLVNSVRAKVKENIPGINTERIFLNATHTHTGPECRTAPDELRFGGGNVSALCGLDLPVMDPVDYVDFAAERISGAIKQAWEKKSPGGISFGLGHAVVGHNRRISYSDGSSRMYGKTDDENFSHVEGYEDHSLNVFGTWNIEGKMTGLVVNLASPSQVSESLYKISADYWHDTRKELRRRFGNELFILPQCSAAGDQSPHILFDKAAEKRMWDLAGRTQRQDIAVRIADGVESIINFMGKEIVKEPVFSFMHKKVELSRNFVTEKDLHEALKEADKFYREYERLKNEIEKDAEMRKKSGERLKRDNLSTDFASDDQVMEESDGRLRWYGPVTMNYRLYRRNMALKERFEIQKSKPLVPADIYLVRVGDMVFASNPFECYLDFGIQIKSRSKALQTFLVQLAGTGTYLPTRRSVEGGGYGSVAASNPVGYEGGRQLVEATLEGINSLFEKD